MQHTVGTLSDPRPFYVARCRQAEDKPSMGGCDARVPHAPRDGVRLSRLLSPVSSGHVAYGFFNGLDWLERSCQKT